MSMHSTNGADIHAKACGCKLKLVVDKKPNLDGSFERFVGTAEGCTYMGRGRKVPKALEKTAEPVELPEVMRRSRAGDDDDALPTPGDDDLPDEGEEDEGDSE